ncbi:MAG: class I SAM-dependent methyltransferase [Mastigocoleus sp. MO_167.B18]|nr:class I SAM-dependent methyltransferase [Mastigocoleus sp. MO_167.B18]
MSTKTQEIVKVYGKSKATDHYLSPSRRDAVKINWEEPFSCMVYRKAIEKTGYRSGDSLEVLDIGSGTGDGISLLTSQLMKESGLNLDDDIDYLGIDICQDMCETARSIHSHRNYVRFLQGDIRQSLPDESFKLYLSCGVPYSHLTPAELQIALQNIFENIRRHNTQSAVVIDVLGKYSIEWVSKWNLSRWDYRMNFFQSDGEADFTPMSFYSAQELNQLIHEAAAQANCKLSNIDFFDRSVMVGRHTSTGEFTPNLSRYRNLVNSLMDVDFTTDFEQLMFDVELGEAPAEIIDFFKTFRDWWNQLIREAAIFCGETVHGGESTLPTDFQGLTKELKESLDNSQVENIRASIIEPILAKYLHNLEVSTQKGLGVGHTLMALVSIDQS